MMLSKRGNFPSASLGSVSHKENALPTITDMMPITSKPSGPMPFSNGSTKGISVSVTKIAGISAGVCFIVIAIVGLTMYLSWIMRRKRRRQKNAHRELFKSTQEGKLMCDAHSLSPFRRDESYDVDIEATQEQQWSTCDSQSIYSSNQASFGGNRRRTIQVPSPLVISRVDSHFQHTMRHLSAPDLLSRRSQTEENEKMRIEKEQRASLFNLALMTSPILEKVLTQSYDFQRGEGDIKRDFDWKNCDFEALEEAAMWLPKASPSTSNVFDGNADQIANLGSPHVSLHPLRHRRSSPAFFQLEQGTLATESHLEEGHSPPLSVGAQFASCSIPPLLCSPQPCPPQSLRARPWDSIYSVSSGYFEDGMGQKRPPLMRTSFSTTSVFSTVTAFTDPFPDSRSTPSRDSVRTPPIHSEYMLRSAPSPLGSILDREALSRGYGGAESPIQRRYNTKESNFRSRPSAIGLIHAKMASSPDELTFNRGFAKLSSQTPRPSTTQGFNSSGRNTHQTSGLPLQNQHLTRRDALSPCSFG
jgi:hypothetical protein